MLYSGILKKEFGFSYTTAAITSFLFELVESWYCLFDMNVIDQIEVNFELCAGKSTKTIHLLT